MMSRRSEPSARIDHLAHDVIGAAIEVHRHLGPGYLESTYQRALELELGLRDLPFQAKLEVVVPYKGTVVSEARIDLVVGGELVVELKAVDRLIDLHRAQVTSYLRAGGFQLGLLLNFNSYVLRDGIRRVIWDGAL